MLELPTIVTLDAAPSEHHVFSGHSNGRAALAWSKGLALDVPGGHQWPAGQLRSGSIRPTVEQIIPATHGSGDERPTAGQ